jgi:hypothetical protein
MTTRQRELDNQRTVIVADTQGLSGRAMLDRLWTFRRPAKRDAQGKN